jgi:hypothetical protein
MFPLCELHRKEELVRLEVFTAVTMKNAVFWDVVPCIYCVNRRFGGTYLLNLQGRRRWRQCFPPKRRFTQDVHGAISQKMAFFIVTAVKTSNPTYSSSLGRLFIDIFDDTLP